MEGFTLVDAAVAAILLVSGILAWSRGFTREVMAILGWVVAAVAAYLLTPQVEPLVRAAPILSDFLQGSCELSVIAAFAVTFAIALIVMAIFTPALAAAVRHSFLAPFDRGLGFLFGVFRGVVLVAVAFLIYDRVVVGETIPMVDESHSARIFAQLQEQIAQRIPEDAPQWFADRYEGLIAPCTTSSAAEAATPASGN